MSDLLWPTDEQMAKLVPFSRSRMASLGSVMPGTAQLQAGIAVTRPLVSSTRSSQP